jgi:hypothetical protein
MTNAEVRNASSRDGGYRAPSLWLSDGWAAVQAKRLDGAAVLARRRTSVHKLHGLQAAAARRAGASTEPSYEAGSPMRSGPARALPTEFEWDAAAAQARARRKQLHRRRLAVDAIVVRTLSA